VTPAVKGMIVTKIDVRLRHEGVVIEGTPSEVNWGTTDRPLWLKVPRWRCPCGTDIDTATMARDRLHDVTGGYVLECPACGRGYMHHCALGFVAG
jgi:hypothetical protein